MNESRSLAETIFIAARDLPDADERAAYLAKACGEALPLRERVERMLAAEQKADRFFAGNPLELDESPLTLRDAAGKEGSVIGCYKLLQQIGEGGCGIVYMAEQEQPIRRRIALKLIKPGMDTRQVIARFEAERQALAMMDHPNIARVLDAGATDTGRPYFVMELVRGIKITEYCDQNNLPTRERLDLFTKVVQAVQHAHQKGIIHRDLKPSNVLVTLHDGVPVPKVIDFGIAKAMEQKLTDKTLFTQFEQFIGTPAYTSPEQAEMSGLDVDTRSDIYSLGVLLYELLVGRTPFDTDDLIRSGLNEMRRIIREKEPDRPSTRLSTMFAEERTATAQRRAVSSPELIHLLKGDLDWIAMKCLEKDRTRRYETAGALAADIQNYLGNEPVTARPPSTAYRLGKLVRRNKLAFAASAAVAVALLAGIVVSTWQAARARRAEKAAQQEKESAEAVLKFFREKILAAGRPEGTEGGLGREVTLRKAIDAAESQISKVFKDRPLVEASIRTALGESYRYLGEPALAIQQLDRSLAIHRQILGFNHPTTLWAMDRLGGAYSEAGKHEQALPLLEETLKVRKTKLGGEHLATLSTMCNLGLAYFEAGKNDQAVPLLEQALRLERAKKGPEAFDTLSTMNNLALAYNNSGKLDQALPLLEEVVKLRKAKWPGHAGTLASMQNLGYAYLRAEKVDQALSIQEETVKLQRARLGLAHPQTLAGISTLAEIYRKSGKPDRMLQFLEETLELFKAHLGLARRETLVWMNNLAVEYENTGKLDRAVPLFEEALELMKAHLGLEDRETLNTMNNLAGAQAKLGKHDLALPLFEEAWKVGKAKLEPEQAETIRSMRGFALALSAQGRDDEVKELAEREFALVHKDAQANARLLSLRGELRVTLGQFNEAGADFAKAIQMDPTNHELYHFLTACLVRIGDLQAYRRNCEQIMARFAEAEAPLVAGRMAKDCTILPPLAVDLPALDRMAERALAAGETHWNFAWFLLNKGLLQYRQGRYGSAAATMQKVLEISGSKFEQHVEAWMVLAMARHCLQEHDKARSALAQGLEIAETKLPKLDQGKPSRNWIGWVFAHALLREARSLIEQDAHEALSRR